jgi:hypothetical protein|tara:strand:+ start:68 stop:502 length:435 start_codon:yes stop_codon:yes gene_type:complete
MKYGLMGITEIQKWEQAVVALLNLDNWQLEWTGKDYEHYDAKGKTPKGFDCVIEMKFRETYYETKMLEAYKYQKLMELPKEVVKLYFVNDPKGNFMFWLNNISLPPTVDKYCPDTTMWTKKRVIKPVYLLEENLASIINLNSTY